MSTTICGYTTASVTAIPVIGVDWQNKDNALFEDGNFAACQLTDGQVSYYLALTTLTTPIASNQTVTGFSWRIKCYEAAGLVFLTSLCPTKGAESCPSLTASDVPPASLGWLGTFGGAGYMCSTGWTAAEATASGIMLGFNSNGTADLFVDMVEVTVYHHTTATPTTATSAAPLYRSRNGQRSLRYRH
jgi:hypothetical protein